MLLNDLYTIEKLETEESKIKAEIRIDPSHKVFQGHFPTQPVLPGVCLIEMLKDIVKEALGKNCRLSEANNIKYLKVVDPTESPQLTFDLTVDELEDGLKVTAVSSVSDGSANFKFKGILV